MNPGVRLQQGIQKIQLHVDKLRISLATARFPMRLWQCANPIVGAFLRSSEKNQLNLLVVVSDKKSHNKLCAHKNVIF
jgi:hypothetical protein